MRKDYNKGLQPPFNLRKQMIQRRRDAMNEYCKIYKFHSKNIKIVIIKISALKYIISYSIHNISSKNSDVDAQLLKPNRKCNIEVIAFQLHMFC